MSKPKGYVFRIDGLPVRNLTKKITLVISAEDCRKATKKAPNSCAAAIAAVRRVPNCLECRVHLGRIFLRIKEGKKEYWLRGKTPNALRTEITAFDRGGSFDPGVYDIMPLSLSDRPNGRTQSTSKKNKNRKGGPKRKLRHLTNVRGNAHVEYGAKAD
jgi:hypothetical protein